MTLVRGGGTKMDAHKVILAASSNFFRHLLKQTNHPHPLLYMKEVNANDILNILDFIYNGEVTILQENLEYSLKVGEESQLRGQYI